MDYFEARPEGFDIFSWCPTPQAEIDAGKPAAPSTQVHMFIPMDIATVVIRFKGPGTLDRLIEALQKHREDVWGKK